MFMIEPLFDPNQISEGDVCPSQPLFQNSTMQYILEKAQNAFQLYKSKDHKIVLTKICQWIVNIQCLLLMPVNNFQFLYNKYLFLYSAYIQDLVPIIFQGLGTQEQP